MSLSLNTSIYNDDNDDDRMVIYQISSVMCLIHVPSLKMPKKNIFITGSVILSVYCHVMLTTEEFFSMRF